MLKRNFSLGILVGALSITSATFAQELTISDWAQPTISHASRFGIYPQDWHYDNFNQEITADKFELLLNNVATKLDNSTYIAEINNSPITKENILNSLYQIINTYEELPLAENGVEYFIQNNLIQGDGTDLRLNDIATTQEAVVFATRLIEQVEDVLDTSTKGLAWQIQHNDNTAYLLGSVHLGPSDLFPIHNNLLEAYHNSNYLIIENNFYNEETYQRQMAIAFYSEGTLADDISPETYDKLAKVCELHGWPLEEVIKLTPFMIANELGRVVMDIVTDGVASTQYSIDGFFTELALFEDKPIFGLEDNFDFKFNDLPLDYVEAELNLALDAFLNPEDYLDMFDDYLEIADYYIIGDLEKFTELAIELDDPIAMEVLYGERDQNMANGIHELLQQEGENTYFVIVGAGHYVVENSVLDRLEDMGYDILDFY